MRQEIGTLIGLIISASLLPTFVVGQQHGTTGTSLVTAPAMVHSTVRVPAPIPQTHPAGHVSAPGIHPTAPRIPAHPVGPNTSTHKPPGQGNTASTNGHYFAPLPSAEDDNGVPGLGFDYPHYAATHLNAGRHHANQGSVFPFIGGGIYIPSIGYVEAGAPAEVAAEAPPAEAATEAGVANVEERATPVPSVKSRPRETNAPSTDYIFVRRDGTVFFAVAYSWSSGNLQYVTQDGLRKLVPIVTLDLDATTQFNEQRGVAFHSPA
jgi:hypothetical protein